MFEYFTNASELSCEIPLCNVPHTTYHNRALGIVHPICWFVGKGSLLTTNYDDINTHSYLCSMGFRSWIYLSDQSFVQRNNAICVDT